MDHSRCLELLFVDTRLQLAGVIMGYEIDHIFVLTDTDAPSAGALLRLGLTEGPPNRHAGQGTANRRFFFDNAMLELLWVENVDEASNPATRPLRLADRWIERSTTASPFGICLRPSDADTVLPPFGSYEYRPSFFPAGLVAHICQGTSLAEPLWFFIARSRLPHALPSHRGPASWHRIGVESITEVTITLPGTPSSVTNAAAAACGVGVRMGAEHRLRIVFDGGRKGCTHDFDCELPMEFCW